MSTQSSRMTLQTATPATLLCFQESTRTLLISLQSELLHFSIGNASKVALLLRDLSPLSPAFLPQINSVLDKFFTAAVVGILQQVPTQEGSCSTLSETVVCGLHTLLETVCGSVPAAPITNSTVISLIEMVVDSLAVTDLSSILPLISEQMCSFGSALEESDQNKLLRVINTLLKRISKTENYLIRGQLHLALCKFLPICHDSGFHFNTPAVKAEPSPEEDSRDHMPSATEVSYEFYQEFWEMQKYLTNAVELTLENNPQKITTTPSKEPLVALRLQSMIGTLRSLLKYFSLNPAKASSFELQPIKYLRSINLLSLQLNDAYFRKVIMVQVLMFCHSVLHPGKNSTSLLESEKKLVLELEAISTQYLEGNDKDVPKCILRFLENEEFWLDIKENWKEKKKLFCRKESTRDEALASGFLPFSSSTESQPSREVIDLETFRKEQEREIREKIKIDGGTLVKFLTNLEPMQLVRGATTTSFAYYYSQASRCLSTFDFENGRQTAFESRAEYNMFEWKAMRTLYRENIDRIQDKTTDKQLKLKEYRLISILQKKEEEFEGRPRKILKQGD